MERVREPAACPIATTRKQRDAFFCALTFFTHFWFHFFMNLYDSLDVSGGCNLVRRFQVRERVADLRQELEQAMQRNSQLPKERQLVFTAGPPLGACDFRNFVDICNILLIFTSLKLAKMLLKCNLLS